MTGSIHKMLAGMVWNHHLFFAGCSTLSQTRWLQNSKEIEIFFCALMCGRRHHQSVKAETSNWSTDNLTVLQVVTLGSERNKPETSYRCQGFVWFALVEVARALLSCHLQDVLLFQIAVVFLMESRVSDRLFTMRSPRTQWEGCPTKKIPIVEGSCEVMTRPKLIRPVHDFVFLVVVAVASTFSA